MIMMLLSSTKAELNDVGKSFCRAKCVIKCAEDPLPILHPNCLKDCESHCDKLSSNPIYNCLNGCRLMKFIVINISSHDLMNNVMNTCMKECEKML